MLFAAHPIVVRGGGDLATGVAVRLRRAGFPVVVLELAHPLAIRRTVAVASAVAASTMTVEGVTAVRVASPAAALAVAGEGRVAVLVAPDLPAFPRPVSAVVDARLAKRPLDTRRDMAPLVVGLGPGLVAGVHCHAVVETMRGHDLGRVIWNGAAAPDTGIPGEVGGRSAERLVRAPQAGEVAWRVEIGDVVAAGAPLGRVGKATVAAPIAGVVRGLISPGSPVVAGLKIGDIDPRADPASCFSISDKARAVGGGVLEAVLTWLDGASA